MVNKKGWIRIVEASIAVLLIASTVLLVYENRKIQSNESQLENLISPILEEMANNNTIRNRTLSYDTTNSPNLPANAQIINDLAQFAKKRITYTNLNYSIIICEPNNLNGCSLTDYALDAVGGVFVKERIIGASLLGTNLNPKKIRFYIWEIK